MISSPALAVAALQTLLFQAMLISGFLIGSLAAIGLGIGCVLQRHQKKGSAILGMVISSLMWWTVITLVGPDVRKAWNATRLDDTPAPSPSGTYADPAGTITNSLGMKFVPIPAGDFLMGTPPTSPVYVEQELFQHPVRITKPFLIGMHEVTQSQYAEVTGGNPSLFKNANLPVEHLSWRDASRSCELLSDLPAERDAGRRYRLPTEAEWEYACRAGTTTTFNTGDALEQNHARFALWRNRTAAKQTAPVGTYPPNAWGLFDTHGNVWEWTSDWFSPDYYPHRPVDDPQGPANGTHHTLRGGSASVESHECHSAVRGEAAAVDGPETTTGQRYALYGDFGVRVVCEVQ